jgi:hypothetical protein
MNLFVVILIVLGVFLIIHGIYEERYQELKQAVKVEYRFVPRSYYDEQLFDSQFDDKMGSLNTEDSEWYHRNIGRDMRVDRMKL